MGIVILTAEIGLQFFSPGIDAFVFTFLLGCAVTGGAAIAGWFLALFRTRLPWFVNRGVYCAACGGTVLFLALLWDDVFRLGGDFAAAVAVPFLVMDWRWLTSSRRRCRVSVVPSLVAAAATLIASLSMFTNEAHVIAAVGLAASATMATQLLMPFSESRSHKVQAATDWFSSLEGLAECVAKESEDARLTPGSFEEAQAVLNNDSPADLVSKSDAARFSTESARDDSNDQSAPDWVVDSVVELKPSSDDSVVGSDIETPPRARMPALILSLVPIVMLPMCGLHRFYVGKVYTGVLYLATAGLLGVGQLVDVILIALGEFRDAEGRLLTVWRSGEGEVPPTGEQVNSLSVVPSPRSFFNDSLAWLGGLTLAATVLVGVTLAVDVPEMMAADVFEGFNLNGSDIQSGFGTKNWPELLRELLQLFVSILVVVTIGLLVASRRSLGIAHMVRVPVVFLPFGGACGLLVEAFYWVSWGRVADGVREEKLGLILEEFLRGNDFIPCVIGAAVAFSSGLLILSWPPKRKAVSTVEQARTPVAQGH